MNKQTNNQKEDYNITISELMEHIEQLGLPAEVIVLIEATLDTMICKMKYSKGSEPYIKSKLNLHRLVGEYMAQSDGNSQMNFKKMEKKGVDSKVKWAILLLLFRKAGISRKTHDVTTICRMICIVLDSNFDYTYKHVVNGFALAKHHTQHITHANECLIALGVGEKLIIGAEIW